jgi:hypothetical protein
MMVEEKRKADVALSQDALLQFNQLVMTSSTILTMV